MERKTITTMIIFAFLALALMSVPAVSAKKLKFNETISLPGLDPGMPGIQPQNRASDWVGFLTGDISGTCYFWETDKNFVTGAKGGKVEHFFEDFLIVFSDGGWIVGHETQGIFPFSHSLGFTTNSANYHAEGPVTLASASPDMQSFVGCKFFEEGVVTFPDWIGVGRGWIGP